MPPTPNLQKRSIDEENVRESIEDVLGCFPTQSTHIMCGDWNARVGDMSPTIHGITLQRKSDDHVVNSRAPWLLKMCM